MKKRILSILLTLVMVIVMLPTAALAADATETADFTTNPTEALELLNAAKTPGAADSTWEGNTLTLNGVNFVTTAANALKLPTGATIVLNGTNTITSTYSGSANSYGIQGVDSLTIQDGSEEGTGTLNVTGGTADGIYSVSYGIYADENVEISGGTVNATGGNATNSHGESHGIYADTNVEISGGTVNANGGTANGDYGHSFGIYADANVKISGGTVNANGGTANGDYGHSFGIISYMNEYTYTSVVEISGGTVNANGGTANGDYGYSVGIFLCYGGSLEISGGIVTATSGTADEHSYGICGEGDGTITITGGTVIAKAGSATTAAALNKQPTLPAAYSWRTSPSGAYFTDTAYEWIQSDAYLELTVVPTYNVTFDANGGTGTMADVTGLTGTYTLPANGFIAPANKQFKGWSLTSDGAIITAVEMTTDRTIYAIWEDIPATLINEVSATVTAPVGGEHPSFTVTVPDGAHYTAVVDTWYDLNNNGAHLTNSDTFVTGNEYQARIHFTANTGYEIANGASYTINGTPNSTTFDTAKQRGMNFVATAPAVITYPLYIAGTQVTSANAGDLSVIPGVTLGADGYAKYYDTSKTLTIKNATITNSTAGDYGFGIQYTGTGTTFTLEAAGTNTVSVTAAQTTSSAAVAVGTPENWTFPLPQANLCVYLLDDATLNLSGGTAEGGYYPSSYGIENAYDGQVTVTGAGTVNAAGGAAEYSYGVLSTGEFFKTGTCTLNATGADSALYSLGLYGGDNVTITAGTLSAVGGTVLGDGAASYGIHGDTSSSDTITITNGVEVLAKGNTVALHKAPTFDSGVTAGGSVNYDGSSAVEYNANDNDTYKWFRAPFTVPVTTYTVTFDANGGSVTPANTTTEATGKLATLPIPTRSGSYTFKGWYTASSGGTQVTVDKVYTENTTIYAQWNYTGSTGGGGGVRKYTIKFETNGGTTIANKSVTRNAKLAEPTAPTKDGFKFEGWYTDKELKTAYDFDTKVTKSFTLYAKWTEIEKEPENDNPVDTDKWVNPFTDVKENDWFFADVQYVAENNLMNGVAADKFAPNDTLTRAMLVTVLYRAEGEPAVNKSIPFADVDMGAYYANAVIWGQQNGIIKGYSETEFGPDDKITREQIAAIMHRYAQYKGYDVESGENTNILSYEDFSSISEYAIASMQYACGSGLMKGKTTSTLNPLDNATRAEIAAILHRFIEANK